MRRGFVPGDVVLFRCKDWPAKLCRSGPVASVESPYGGHTPQGFGHGARARAFDVPTVQDVHGERCIGRLPHALNLSRDIRPSNDLALLLSRRPACFLILERALDNQRRRFTGLDNRTRTAGPQRRSRDEHAQQAPPANRFHQPLIHKITVARVRKDCSQQTCYSETPGKFQHVRAFAPGCQIAEPRPIPGASQRRGARPKKAAPPKDRAAMHHPSQVRSEFLGHLDVPEAATRVVDGGIVPRHVVTGI